MYIGAKLKDFWEAGLFLLGDTESRSVELSGDNMKRILCGDVSAPVGLEQQDVYL